MGIARIPLSRIPIHDNEAITAAAAALAEQQAVSCHPSLSNVTGLAWWLVQLDLTFACNQLLTALPCLLLSQKAAHTVVMHDNNQ